MSDAHRLGHVDGDQPRRETPSGCRVWSGDATWILQTESVPLQNPTHERREAKPRFAVLVVNATPIPNGVSVQLDVLIKLR